MRKIPNLQDQLKGLEDDLAAIKALQRTGAGNVQGFAHIEPGDYDLHFLSNKRITKFLLTLTHADPGKFQIVNLSWSLSHGTKPLTDTGGVFVNQQAQQMQPLPGQTQWLLSFRNNSFPPEFTGGVTNFDCYVKFIFFGTTDISLTITPL